MLNPNIILAGRQPDMVGIADRATTARQRAREFGAQNALNDFVGQNGAGLVNGDQNALRGLAQHGMAGLQAAQGVQSHAQGMEAGQLSMDATRQNMDVQRQTQARLSRQEKRQIAAALAESDAQAVAQDLEKQRGVMAGLGQFAASGNEQGYNQFAAQHGIDPAEMPMQDYPAHAAAFDQDLVPLYEDALGRHAGPDVPASIRALEIRAQRSGLAPGSPEYQAFMASGGVPSQSTSLSVDPATGAVSFTQGSEATTSGNGKSLTVDEGKNTGFLIRARESNEVLNRLEGEGTDLSAKIASKIPVVGNYMQSPEYRQYDQARRDFINAVLRRESGAVINPEEFSNAELQYFPQPGDDPDTISQKRRNRENALRGFEIGAGDGVNRIGANDAPAADFSAMAADQILQMDLAEMSEADLRAYMARMDELGL